MAQKKRQRKDHQTAHDPSSLDMPFVLAHIAHWYLLFAVIVGGLFVAYVLTRGII